MGLASPPTMKDIALALGVHKSTVQRALAGDRRIEAATIARVQAAAARLGYDPDRHLGARRLSFRRSGRRATTGMVALFFPPHVSTSTYFMRLISGVMDELSLADHDLITTFLVSERPLRLPACVRRGDVDAALAVGHPDYVAMLAQALASEPENAPVPLVSMINPAAGAAVVADVTSGAAWAMERLLALGHRHMIAIEGMAHRGEARLQGWNRALTARGLDPQRHLTIHSILSVHELAETLDRALQRTPVATAVLAANDPTAGAIASLLARRGLQVPIDISLVGFDDSDPLADALGRNRLTSIALPLEEIGRQSARLALELANGGAPRSVLLPVTPHERGTIGPPRV